MTVLRKDVVIMDCQAQGELPIRIRWLKNGSPAVESDRVYQLSNGSLFISETESRKGEKSDEGSYQCLAQNKYGAILSQKARLTIASKFGALVLLPSCCNFWSMGWCFVVLSEILVVSAIPHPVSPDFPKSPNTHSWITLSWSPSLSPCRLSVGQISWRGALYQCKLVTRAFKMC